MKWKIRRLETLYRERLGSVKRAFSVIRPGSRVYISTACAAPRHLVSKMAEFPNNFADTEIFHIVSLVDMPFTDPSRQDMFRLNTFFIGDAAREAVRVGNADYTPIFLSEIPKLIQRGRLRFDVALVQVAPPDEFGNCSLGVSVESVKAAIRHADYVVAQVNRNMPRTMGDSSISVDELDAIMEYDEPILEFHAPKTDDVSDRIGFYVSRLVPNGATLQVGYGKIPNAVLRHLMDKRDLGVHTEMFSDALIDLYEAGVITNRNKTLHPGKVVSAFCLGTKRLYDAIHNNPAFEFYPTDYTSDPRNVAMNKGLVAINSALEIDLTGQVCADSLGTSFQSGIGGQADFIRGAALAEKGKPIIALPSTAEEGRISRIVATLQPGAGVVTTRGDVHYVVTEYGVAFLHGKSIRERALALINIAHPDFREELLEKAKQLNYVYPDQVLSADHATMPDQHWRFLTRKTEHEVTLRPIHATDEDKIRRLFYTLREEDIFYRFMGTVKTLPHKKALPLVALDYEEKFAVVACLGEEPDDEIIGVGRWFWDRASNMAEVAFAVNPAWQGQGLGTKLLQVLMEVAKQKGIAGFTAEVMGGNRKMLGVFYRSGCNVRTHLDDGVYFVRLRFNDLVKRAPTLPEDVVV